MAVALLLASHPSAFHQGTVCLERRSRSQPGRLLEKDSKCWRAFPQGSEEERQDPTFQAGVSIVSRHCLWEHRSEVPEPDLWSPCLSAVHDASDPASVHAAT